MEKHFNDYFAGAGVGGLFVNIPHLGWGGASWH